MRSRALYFVRPDDKTGLDLSAELVQKGGSVHITIDHFVAVQGGKSRKEMAKDVVHHNAFNTTDGPPATTAALRHQHPKRAIITIDTSNSRYNVVRHAAAKLGWDEANPNAPAKVVWVDTSISLERVLKLPDGSHINHFPGMLLVCRKVDSARHLMKLKRQFGSLYKFVPSTFLNYDEYMRTRTRPQRLGTSLDVRPQKKAVEWYIVKPDSGCMGKGICLTQNPKKEMFENSVVQSYVHNPLLIDGCKWDMRVYVLVLSVDPLKVYIYKDGFIRLCTEKYEPPTPQNATNMYVHLTNYAIHKKSKKYVENTETEDGEKGCKRSFGFLFNHVKSIGGDPDMLWERIGDVAVKTLLSAHEHLRYSYRAAFPEGTNTGTSCFELLGFDILVDEDFGPTLLEVNHAPSFTCDSMFDFAIKSELIEETLCLVGADVQMEPRWRQAAPRSSEMRETLLKRFRRAKDEQELRTAKRFQRVFPSHPGRAAEYEKIMAASAERSSLPAPISAAATVTIPFSRTANRSGYSSTRSATTTRLPLSATPLFSARLPEKPTDKFSRKLSRR